MHSYVALGLGRFYIHLRFLRISVSKILAGRAHALHVRPLFGCNFASFPLTPAFIGQ